jgi:hypothetical protein
MERNVVSDGTGVLHEVRAACHRTAAAARLVQIDDGAVADLAGRLVAERGTPGGSPPDPWVVDTTAGDDEEQARLVLTLATVNFGSGYHPRMRKRPGCSGATSTALSVREWAASEPLTATRLASVTADEVHERFGQPTDDPLLGELMGMFARALVELGTHVRDTFHGSFLALVQAAGGRAAGLVGELDRLPSFRDVATYDGRPVPFYKRAQLAAADLDRAFGGTFEDLDDLTAFADNLVPHVLRVEGVLRYDDRLAARIDAGEPLPAGSAEEVEIRAAGVEAVERLRVALGGRGIGVPVRASDLDYLLWRRGSGARFKAIPRHRTRTVFY